ncbi:LamG-like jellyroll fold domain-containing protein [Catenovulum sediminis]|uniref:LamG-like jellyroll fold domain-containing protein n=1 Tax=Catenovulum sediminis TaxID=1740262 RepID=A0ABV1RDG2_9ALTE
MSASDQDNNPQASTLSKEQQRLIADYLAGKDVQAQLIEACKNNPNVKQELAKLIANDRLIRFEIESSQQSQSVDEQAGFSASVMDKIITQGRAPKSILHKPIQHKPTQQASETGKITNFNQYKKQPRNWFSTFYALAASVAVFVVGFFITSFLFVQNNLAVVTKVAAVSAVNNLVVGQSINRGKISLDAGYSEIKMGNGVILLLEAPIRLDIRSQDLVILEKGKLVAKVPPQAIGFRVDTPSSEIIDLGTEFAVDVNDRGDSQVHVLEGEVKARSSKLQAYKMLRKNQALSFSLDEKVEFIKSSPNLFMRALPGKSVANSDYLHWSFDSKQLDKQLDKQFGNKQAGAFLSNGKGISGKQYPAYDKTPETTAGQGEIAQTVGVFGQAIAFNGMNNWLETDFPGIAGDAPRTVSFWVKVPKDIEKHEVFGIVSWGTQEFYSAWQISPNPYPQNGPLGALRIGTYNAQVVGTKDLRDGQWHHVAVVLYGGESSDISTHVLMYVDGELEKTHGKSFAKVDTKITQKNSRPLALGRNIGYEAEHEPNKYFRGSVDELYVFDTALEQQQIKQLMQSNKFSF